MARRAKKRESARHEQAMVVWQPKGFDPCNHLPQHLHRDADYARFYVGMIVQFTLRMRNVKREDRQWARLSHKRASRFFPDTDTYKAVRDALIAARVVECDWDYTIGQQSMGYRLGERYRDTPIREFTITGKAAYHLCKKQAAWLDRRQQRLGDVERYLLAWLCKVRVSRYASKALPQDLETRDSYRVQLENLRRLADPRSTILTPLSRCPFGRIHTPVAHGWKGFRKFLTIDKSQLVGIDIRNAQPLIFGLVLRQMSARGGKIPEWLMPPIAGRATRYLDLSPAETPGGHGREECKNEPCENTSTETSNHKPGNVVYPQVAGQKAANTSRRDFRGHCGHESGDRAQNRQATPAGTNTPTTSTPTTSTPTTSTPTTSTPTTRHTSVMTQEIETLRASYKADFQEDERVYVDSSTNVNICQDGTAPVSGLDPPPEVPPIVVPESLAEEVNRYVQLCERGQFYNWMMEQFGIPREGRDGFKRRVFKYVFFGKHERSRHSDEWKQFERAYPQIARLIGEIKRQHGYTVVAHLLQRVESSLMINRVCRRLMKEHPNVPVVTIHDSILTTKRNVSLVSRIIKEEFFRVGLHPSLHQEDYANMPTPVPTVRAQKRARRKPPAPHRRVTDQEASTCLRPAKPL